VVVGARQLSNLLRHDAFEQRRDQTVQRRVRVSFPCRMELGSWVISDGRCLLQSEGHLMGEKR
jgi:hypothetical protein